MYPITAVFKAIVLLALCSGCYSVDHSFYKLDHHECTVVTKYEQPYLVVRPRGMDRPVEVPVDYRTYRAYTNGMPISIKEITKQ